MKDIEIKEEKKFSIRTIIFQMIDQLSSVVGVVVGGHMFGLLNKKDREEFERNADTSHICLVLGWFSDNKERELMFSTSRRFVFPSYTVGQKDVNARVADLDAEMNLFESHGHLDDGYDSGNPELRSRRQIFGFNEKQKETLIMVKIVRHYLNGGTIDDLPNFSDIYIGNSEELFKELQKAIPL